MASTRQNASHDQNFVPTLMGVSTVDGKTPTPLEVDPSTGYLQVSGSGGGGSGGAITDGVSGAIKATVFDLTNSNPLATQIVDANGTAITSFGGGTQYADATAAATPTGTQINFNNSGTQNSVSLTQPLPIQFRNSTGTIIGSSANPIRIDPTGTTTQPISAVSLPLPTGAATAAKQPALGTAGTASADVITVQGVTNMTPLQTVGNVAAGATDSGNPVKVGGVNMTTPPTLTDGQRGDLQIGTRGSLHVELWSTNGANAINAIASNADGQATGSTATRLEVMSRTSWYNGTTFDRSISVANGTNSTGIGIGAMGLLAQVDDTSPTSITENQFGNVRMSTARALLVVQKSSTSTGSNVSTSTTNATLLAANVNRNGGSIYNDATGILYVKFGTTATSTDFKVPLAAGTYYEIPAGYTGRIDGILSTGTGTARIAEET